jgi:hypothetical protein
LSILFLKIIYFCCCLFVGILMVSLSNSSPKTLINPIDTKLSGTKFCLKNLLGGGPASPCTHSKSKPPAVLYFQDKNLQRWVGLQQHLIMMKQRIIILIYSTHIHLSDIKEWVFEHARGSNGSWNPLLHQSNILWVGCVNVPLPTL